ncbi:MAG: EamA family transporter [Clostridia bacterium]|nr:EamA family transporter [Clostridia bacterium]
MTKEIWIILACVPLYVVNSFCDKYVSSKSGSGHNFLYNTVKFLIGSICLLPMFLGDHAPRFQAGVLLCGIACGIMYAVSKTIILRGYEMTSVAFMTLCHASGMILPCVLGHFFWSEPLGLLSLIGILLAVASIVLLKDSKGEKKGFDTVGIVIGILVFLTSGGVMIAQKMMGLYFSEQSVSAYNFYSFAVACLLLGVFVRPRGESKTDLKRILLCAAGSAVSLCVISLVMTALAGSVPSAIMFPLFNGSGIIFVCICSVFAFKEPLTAKKILGLVLGLCGLFLVNL